MNTIKWPKGRAWMASMLATSVLLGIVPPSAAGQTEAAAEHRDASSLEGDWVLDGAKFVMRIASCDATVAGASKSLCGTVIRMLPDATKEGDRPNDEMVGWKLLRDFTTSNSGEWEGQMANFENHKIYSCVMRLESSDRLWVRPYIGIVALGKTHMWTRVNAAKDLPAESNASH
jgi:uncharacterized protein (DUF2147 family)